MSDVKIEKTTPDVKMEKQTPHVGDLCKVGAYSFVWTEDHYSRDKLDYLKRERDEVGAAAVNRIYDIHQKRQEEAKEKAAEEAAAAEAAAAKAAEAGATPEEGSAKPGRPTPAATKIDLMAVLNEFKGEDKALSTFWDEAHAVPEWVDWEQLERGQKVLYRHALAMLIGFAFQGFVGETSGSVSAVAVLLRTGGFSTKMLKKRLLETFQFLLEITHSLEYLRPGGKGHATAMRVRLLHSMVQQRICAIAERRPDFFDFEEHGLPVSNHDSVHSIATFCCNPLFIQMPLMGLRPSARDVEDYVALFRYVAYLMGTPTDYFVSAARGRAVMESIAHNELQITDQSLVVGHNFVETLKDLPPINVSPGFIEAGSRVLNGQDVCDDMGFGRPGWLPYACFTGHCWLVRALAFAQRCSPALDAKVIDASRDGLHAAIIQSKQGLQGGSKHEFQYVPNGTVTGKERTDRKLVPLAFYQRPLEMLYIIVFLVGCFLMGAGVFLGLLALVGAYRLLAGPALTILAA